jgi:hypothetical protein
MATWSRAYRPKLEPARTRRAGSRLRYFYYCFTRHEGQATRVPITHSWPDSQEQTSVDKRFMRSLHDDYIKLTDYCEMKP